MTQERASEIYNKFSKFTENGNKKLIEGFNIAEIEITLIHYSRDKDWPPYKAMELRVAELKDLRTKKEKWIDRIIGFISGIIMSLIVQSI